MKINLDMRRVVQFQSFINNQMNEGIFTPNGNKTKRFDLGRNGLIEINKDRGMVRGTNLKISIESIGKKVKTRRGKSSNKAHIC